MYDQSVGENSVRLEFARLNNSLIETGFQTILKSTETSQSVEGIIGQYPLTLTNAGGNTKDCLLRYCIGRNVLISKPDHRSQLIARWEVVDAKQNDLPDYSMYYEEFSQHPNLIAFRSYYPYRYPFLDINLDHIILAGFVYTNPEWQHVGIPTSLLAQSVKPDCVSDFVHRSKPLLEMRGINNFKTAKILISDSTSTFQKDSHNKGWTSRFAEKLGFKPVYPNETPNFDFYKEIDLT